MDGLRRLFSQPWPVAVMAGLLIAAIALAGTIGLLKNFYVKDLTEGSLGYAVDLQERSNELRAAVFDMRYHHRSVLYEGPSQGRKEDFEEAYRVVQERVDRLDELGVRDPEEPQPERLRRLTEDYYAEFRPAMDLYGSDREAFRAASDRAMGRLNELEEAAAEIDELSARDASRALDDVERAENEERVVLFAVALGLVLALVALTYTGLRLIRLVAELRQLHADQRETAQALAEASRAKTDFLADVSHEIRTPLTVLRSNAEFGLAIDRNWAHADLLRDIVKESVHMSRMIEDLLFLARSDSASLPIEKTEVDVSLFMAELAGRAEVLARERGASFAARVDGEGRMQADPTRVEQAVLTLVDNAAKYGDPGGLVILSSSVDSGELCISVEDTGPGIPESDLPHVFERFYRVGKGRSRSKGGGSGLGLSIAKTIADLHGGRILADSRAGEGTRMTLCLPMVQRASNKDLPTASKRES